RAASFTVDMTSVARTKSERTILDVSAYHRATFVLAGPIGLAGLAAGGTIQRHTATGALTIHGATRSTSFTLEDERLGNAIYALADIPVTYADWRLSMPFGIESRGTIEVLLRLIPDAGHRA